MNFLKFIHAADLRIDSPLKAWAAAALGEMTTLPRDLADAEASVLAQLSDLAAVADGAGAP